MVLGEHAIPVVKAQLFAQSPVVRVAEPIKGAVAQKPLAQGTGRKDC